VETDWWGGSQSAWAKLAVTTTMRTTFIIDDNNHAQSDIRSKQAPHTIAVGTPVVTSAPYETERGILPAGAKGFVIYVDETSGELGILMEGLEPALVHWDNTLIIVPYDTEDLLAVLRFLRVQDAAERRWRTYRRLVATHLVSLFHL
jgi:hypothetical protein